MLYPTKYENINDNLLVMGGWAIAALKQRVHDIESLFQELSERNKKLNIKRYFDLLTFLWSADLIEINDYKIFLKQTNVPA